MDTRMEHARIGRRPGCTCTAPKTRSTFFSNCARRLQAEEDRLRARLLAHPADREGFDYAAVVNDLDGGADFGEPVGGMTVGHAASTSQRISTLQ